MKIKTVFASAAVLFLMTVHLRAAEEFNYIWKNPAVGNDWFNAANWTTLDPYKDLPGAADRVLISAGHVVLDGASGPALADSVRPGNDPSKSGTLSMTGAAELIVSGNFALGASGTGYLYMDGDAALSSADAHFGSMSGGAGFATLGGSATWTLRGTEMVIGYGGAGILTLEEDAALNAPDFKITLGLNPTGDGTLNLNGGTVSTQGFVRGAGAGALGLNGGTIRATASTGNFFDNLGPLYIESGGVTLDVGAGLSVTATNNFSGPGDFTKTGAGKLTLSGALDLGGELRVLEGTLALAQERVLRPGDLLRLGLGTQLDLESRLTLDGGVLVFELGADGQSGALGGAGAVNLWSGVIQLELTPAAYTAGAHSYDLIGADILELTRGASDYVALLHFASLDPNWEIKNPSFINGTLQFDLAPIPEPTTWTLMVGGGGALLALRRRIGK